MTRNEDSITAAVRHYRAIRDDYRYDGSIFRNEDERSAKVKWIIDNKLTPADRIIITKYIDCQSTRKLGAALMISHTLVAKIVRRITAQILEEYEKIKDREI